jgi:hypothetical protein
MKSIHIEIPKSNFKFYLFENDLDESTRNKLKKLGMPDFSINFPEDPKDNFEKTSDGFFRQGDFYCNSISPMTPIDGATHRAIFDPSDNSINVELEGTFFCVNIFEEDISPSIPNLTFGYISGTRLNNDKGKLIKKPKDQWGMTDPLEARIEKNSYDGGSCIVNFKVIINDSEF